MRREFLPLHYQQQQQQQQQQVEKKQQQQHHMSEVYVPEWQRSTPGRVGIDAAVDDRGREKKDKGNQEDGEADVIFGMMVV